MSCKFNVYFQESGITMEPSVREPFIQLNSIKEALQNRNIEPALKWAQENRTQLEAQVLNIIFL